VSEQSDLLALLADAVVRLQPDRVAELARKSLKLKIPPDRAMTEGLAKGMKLVGEKFAAKEYFVPEVLLAARAMYAGFDVLKQQIGIEGQGNEGIKWAKGKIALGVVQGDIHDIGKNIVRVLAQASGFEVADLGRNVPDAAFIRAAENGCRVIGLSSLMTTTMPRMAGVIEALDRAGLRRDVKVIIGGAPVTSEFARRIGADGFAPDAHTAVKEIERMMPGNRGEGDKEVEG
jgi:methylmalonyl-CoA mutase cobalamin-binding domain/chain